MKSLLGDNYLRSGEVKKSIIADGRNYGTMLSLAPDSNYLKTVEKDEYLSGLIAFNLSFKEGKNDNALYTVEMKEKELTRCVRDIITEKQYREELNKDTWVTASQNSYNWFCKADKMIEMSKYRGMSLNNSGYQHSNEVVITPLDKIFIQIALSDFYREEAIDKTKIIKTSALPHIIGGGNTSWMQSEILAPLADDNEKMDEAFQKVEQRLSLLYKGYTESVAEKPTYKLVTGTYRRVGNDMTDTPSVTECMFHYRVRAPIALFLLIELCKKNDIELGGHIGKIKLFNNDLLKSMAQNSWLLKIYEDLNKSSKTKLKDKNEKKREKNIKEYKVMEQNEQKFKKWINIIKSDREKTKAYKDVVTKLTKKNKEARLEEINKKLQKKLVTFSIEHYIKCCILGKVSRTEGLDELPYLAECLPQIIRQITELGRKIEVKGKIENLNMIDIGKIKELKDFHKLFSNGYPNAPQTNDMLKSALSYNSDDIYKKLYRFLGYGFDKDKDIINVNDILFYLCCPLL